MSDEAVHPDDQRTVPDPAAPAYESAAVDRARNALRETDEAPTSVPEAVGGALIGRRYKLLELIGEGGMGVVWMAEQRSPIRRVVAVKLIKAGMDSAAVLARFEAERQALAMMDHPNIARIFDGGTTDRGHPFFVMELVKGLPLTRYCDERKMPLNERLDLFVQVCGAVQHAHQKGIIHRDLKPGNLLVTEHDGKPVPKVIDFGLVKALGGSSVLTDRTLHTSYGAVAGTPQYMAPEQVAINALDVDTRADIYALGVILYELLAGSTPHEARQLHQAAWEEIRRLIREVDPPRPSLRITNSKTIANLAATRHTEPARLCRLIAGDLDWIVMKALEKDRHRRYGTASDLAADLQRHMAGEAVLAAPPTAGYRLRKFTRKYRVALTTTAVIVLTLLAGVLVSTLEAIRASKAETNARKQTIEANNQRLAANAAANVATKAQLQSVISAGISANEADRGDAALLLFGKAATMSSPFPTIHAANAARLEFQRRRAWRPVAALPHQYSNVKELTFHRSNRYVLTVGLDEICRLHDLNDDRVIPFPVPDGEATAASWSADGTTLAIATRTQALADTASAVAALDASVGRAATAWGVSFVPGTKAAVGALPDLAAANAAERPETAVAVSERVKQAAHDALETIRGMGLSQQQGGYPRFMRSTEAGHQPFNEAVSNIKADAEAIQRGDGSAVKKFHADIQDAQRALDQILAGATGPRGPTVQVPDLKARFAAIDESMTAAEKSSARESADP